MPTLGNHVSSSAAELGVSAASRGASHVDDELNTSPGQQAGTFVAAHGAVSDGEQVPASSKCELRCRIVAG